MAYAEAQSAAGPRRWINYRQALAGASTYGHRTSNLAEREMGAVERGDMLVVEGAGAYCAGMSSKNYNSFPEAPEVMRGRDGKMHLIRKRQTLEQITTNEVELADDAC